MTIALALAIAVLFGCGVYLILMSDLVRIVIGIALISNAANLTLLANGLSRGVAPIRPIPDGEVASDPLVQALTLTALVIGFAVVALLFAIVIRVYRTHRTVDLDEIVRAGRREEEQAEEAEREGAAR